MRKSILISVIAVLFSVSIYGQENRISLGAGYPINLTNHWLVDKWEKPISFDLKFIHSKNHLTIGGGLSYAKYDISWFRYYNSEKNTISNLNPYLLVGLNMDKRIVSVMPLLYFGYSSLLTDVEIYNGGKGGFYSAVGFVCNFKITEKIQLGIGVNYNIIFNKLDFEYEGMIHYDFTTTEDDVMKSLSLNLNLAYKL